MAGLGTGPHSWHTLGVAFFLAFVLLNKGAAVGDREAHPVAGLFVGNVYFCLFLAGVLFFPVIVSYRQRLVEQLKQWQTLLLLLGIFLVSLGAFSPLHPYNQADYAFFVRNKVLLFWSATFMGQLLCFLPIGCALLFLSEVTLCERAFVLLYPTTFLFLLPMWLIEQRYYLIPFAFFLAMREQRSPATEMGLSIMFIMAALFVVYGTMHRLFFL